jgi:hypothetical protein
VVIEPVEMLNNHQKSKILHNIRAYVKKTYFASANLVAVAILFVSVLL